LEPGGLALLLPLCGILLVSGTVFLEDTELLLLVVLALSSLRLDFESPDEALDLEDLTFCAFFCELTDVRLVDRIGSLLPLSILVGMELPLSDLHSGLLLLLVGGTGIREVSPDFAAAFFEFLC
jgi:hypothetical protein